MKEWAKMPSDRLMDAEKTPLKGMTWSGDDKSNYIAALMVYIVLVHHANAENSRKSGCIGTVSMPYSTICDLIGISRAKVSKGLCVLENVNLITREIVGKTNVYTIVNHENISGWAKLPAKGLYDKNLSTLTAFTSFKLRSKVELNALKIYLVIAAFKHNHNNYTLLSYEKITKYANVQRNDIRSALSLLVTNNLVQIDSIPSEVNEHSHVNVYRLCHLEVYKHRGTQTIESILDQVG